MNYLIWQIAICLLVAALFGLFFGWLLWGTIVRTLRKESAENTTRLTKLQELPTRLNELETRHSSLLAEKEAESLKFAARGNEFKHALTDKEAEIDQLRMTMFEADALHRADLSQKEAHLSTLSVRIAELEPLIAKTAGGEMRDAQPLQAAEESLPLALHETDPLSDTTGRVPLLEAEVARHKEAPSAQDARIADLEAGLHAKELEIAKHREAHTAATTQIAELAPLAALVPVLQASLSAKDSETAQHVASHAAKDARIEALLEVQNNDASRLAELAHNVDSQSGALALAVKEARIAELKPIAARVPDLEASVAAKDREIAQHLEAHTAKDAHIQSLLEANATSATRLAELEPLAARLPGLHASLNLKDTEIAQHLDAHAAKDAHILSLFEAHTRNAARNSELEPLAARIPELEATLTAKDDQLLQQVDAYSTALAAKDAHIAELEPLADCVPALESSLDAKDRKIGLHIAAHAAKDTQIQSLLEVQNTNSARIAELEPLAARIPELEASLTAKDAEIAQHIEAHSIAIAAKEASVAELEPIAASVPELHSSLAAKDAQLADLHVKLSEIEPLANLVPRLQSDLTEKDNQLAAHLITHASDWESFEKRLQEYNAGREHEVAELRQRIETMSHDLQQARESRASALDELALLRAELAAPSARDPQPPKTMAAAAGFYSDASPSSAAESSNQNGGYSLRHPGGDSGENVELKHLRSVLSSLLQPLPPMEIANRAFKLSELRNFKNGTEQEDWLKAENQLRTERLELARHSLPPEATS